MMEREEQGAARVLIAGGGHAGLLLALALDQARIPATVIDPQPADEVLAAPFDGRALALMQGSKRVFETLGLWPAVEPVAQPVWGVRVRDQTTGAEVTYDAGALGDKSFGYGIENRLLRARLLERAGTRPRIGLLAPARLAGLERRPDAIEAVLENGAHRTAELLVGADGRSSSVRGFAGIGVDRHGYRQTALTFAIRHERPHESRVREFLRPAGPLALLPIGADLCSVTWVEPSDFAETLLDGSRAALARALRERLDDVLGGFEIVGEPAGYPLAAQHARRYVAPRLALVGDAAHGVHPIHAQGFNLGVRGIATLAEVLADAREAGLDLGNPEVLMRYERRHRPDAGLVLSLTDGLNLLFSNDLAPAKLLRRLGLAAVERLPALKQAAMRRGMGLAGPLPKLARGLPL